MKTLLEDAKKKKYAVGAFNAMSMDQVHSVISCAESLSAPVIIQLAETQMPFAQLDELIKYVSSRIDRSRVPIALHLDHGINFETILKCIHKGFSSVMFDGSTLPYEENVRISKEVVAICSKVGVTVEAELGHVGDEGMDGGEGGVADRNFFTDPDQAKDFVERTGIDALAIAFGNLHGKYKGTPDLNFDLLNTVVQKVNIPLVLHGGSGIPPESFKKAISLGICKINFFSGMEAKILDRMHEKNIYPHALGNKYVTVDKSIKDLIGTHIKIFGSNNQCQNAKPFLD